MEEKKVADYFVVAGLPPRNPEPLEEFSNESSLKPTHRLEPVVDIAVINHSLGEKPPPDYQLINTTPNGYPADLNHGSMRAYEMYLCLRRGRDKPPLTDIGVLYEGKERVMSGCEVVYQTPQGRSANVNNSSSSRIYITARRADKTAACDTLAVMDICVILGNKSESPPHAFCRIPKTLNKGMVGSDVFVCYKKSMAKTNFISYKPGILSRYPQEDNPNFPLPDAMPMFCLPLGATLESWDAAARHPLPVFSTFVLTGLAGKKAYGTAVMFYEEYDQDALGELQKQQLGLIPSAAPPGEESEEGQGERGTVSGQEPEQNDSTLSPTAAAAAIAITSKTVHQTKCICILSRWPFFDTFKKFLSYIYRISISGPHPVPIERHISHFLTEVPFPSPQRPRILVQLNTEAISLSQPEETPLPQSGASFITLLKNLGSEDCMTLLLCTLMEHKILIHSLRPAVLTSAAEAVASMIFPFHWQCPYIPLCPLFLSDVIDGPFAFIYGVDSRYFDFYEPPVDVTCVDLDTNRITLPDEKKGFSLKMFPKRPLKVLRSTLDKLYAKVCQDASDSGAPMEVGFESCSMDQDFVRRRRELVMETAIEETFLRFMGCLLKGYNNYLLPITKAPTNETTDLASLFDIQAFIKSRDKAYHKFYTHMTKTQAFQKFIQERSFVSDKDASLAFFDECTEKVDENKDEPRLIELEDNSNSERTVFITPPEPVGLPEGALYSYSSFPSLDHSLFPVKPSKPSLVAALKVANQCPHSPMTRRTKQEVKFAQKIAQRHATSPALWAKCLLWHCYSLWFIHLPSYVKSAHSKTKALRTAYDVLVRMQGAKLQPPDEVCYRVLMQLCGLYHQPILAVKVLFEMRRAGVQPNAITYGFYNKAVLESKWPSSEDTNAYLLWNKLRNMIRAVAQFRRGLRGRRLSMYSNSESDFDRISRASTDSYLEDNGVEKTEASKAAELVSGLVSVDGHGNEERISTGGLSDRGYSSMTLDDAKRVSIVIGSQDSLDSLGQGSKGIRGEKIPSRGIVLQKPANNRRAPGGKDSLKLNFHPTNSTLEEDTFPVQSSSIVKQQSSSVTSTGTLKAGSVGSQGPGGRLNSEASMDESVFTDVGFTQSLGLKSPQEPSAASCQGDGEVTLGAMETDDRTPVVSVSTNDNGAAFSEGNSDDVEKNTKDTSRTFQGSSDSPATSKVSSQHQTCDAEGNVDLLLSDESAADLIGDMSSDPILAGSDIGRSPTAADGDRQSQSKQSLTSSSSAAESSNCESAERTATESSTDQTDSLQSCDTIVGVDGTDSAPTTPSSASPSHSIRTPVTENDPLGLFMDGPPMGATTVERPTLSEAALSSPKASARSTKGKSSQKNATLIDLEPFGGVCSTPKKGKGGRAGSKGGRNESASSGEGSNPSSPLEPWSPLSQSHSEPRVNAAPSPRAAKGKASTLPANAKLHEGAAPGDTGMEYLSPSAHGHKRLGSALRSLTSRFTSRFTELKASMSTPSKVHSASSSGSLNKTLDIDQSLQEQQEEEEESMLPSNRSDHLGQGDDCLDLATMEDVVSGRNKLRLPSKYAPFVSGLLGSLKTIHHNETLQGWASTLGSMTVSLKESFTEGWGLSVDEDDDDYYYESASLASSGSGRDRLDSDPTKEFMAWPSQTTSSHRYSQQPQQTSIESSSNHGASEEGVSLASLRQASGSVQSIPQAFFNCAMEVEICSLSRCQTCQSLVYDEEIMAGWSADDSNLNTSCQFCGAKFVPFLQITVKDYRQGSKPGLLSPSQSVESMYSIQSMPNVQLRGGPGGGSGGIVVGPPASVPPPSVQQAQSSVTNSEIAAPLCNGDSKSVDSQSVKSVEGLTSTINGLTDDDDDSSPDSCAAVKPLTPDDDDTSSLSQSSPTKEPPSSHERKNSAGPESLASGSADELVLMVQTSNGNPVDASTKSDSSQNGNLMQFSPSSSVEDKKPSSQHQSPVHTVKETGSSHLDGRRCVSDDHLLTVNGDEKETEAKVNNGTGKDSGRETDGASSVGDQVDTDSMASSGPEEKQEHKRRCVSEPVRVPYLSPLVLRKEMENVLDQEGDMSLNKSDFVDEHPIIYWNLVWYFKRLDVVSHINGFILQAPSTNRNAPPPKSWSSADSRHVAVRAVWDNLRLQDDMGGPPMYQLWNPAATATAPAVSSSSSCSAAVSPLGSENQLFSQGLMEYIVMHITKCDVINPIKHVLQERDKHRRLSNSGRFRSMYRDILFLSFMALGRDLIDQDAYDREYRLNYNYLKQHDGMTRGLRVCDIPPSMAVMWCRRLFSGLEL